MNKEVVSTVISWCPPVYKPEPLSEDNYLKPQLRVTCLLSVCLSSWYSGVQAQAHSVFLLVVVDVIMFVVVVFRYISQLLVPNVEGSV